VQLVIVPGVWAADSMPPSATNVLGFCSGRRSPSAPLNWPSPLLKLGAETHIQLVGLAENRAVSSPSAIPTERSGSHRASPAPQTDPHQNPPGRSQ
jgi:hypothetical protein